MMARVFSTRVAKAFFFFFFYRRDEVRVFGRRDKVKVFFLYGGKGFLHTSPIKKIFFIGFCGKFIRIR
jgi:hypothetical protein